jgi:integrase
MASYHAAIEDRRTPDPARFRSLVTLYKASEDYRSLASSTKKNWGPWLDRIAEHFGGLRVVQFDRPEKIRPVIRRWRNQWADKPRSADYGMQVLSRVLSYAVDPVGKIAGNLCEGVKQLYRANRSEIIWTDADISQLKQTCSMEIAQAVDVASHTGLRVGDLPRLSWSHVGDDAIVIATGKSKHRREAIIPLYDNLKHVLAAIPKRSTTILTNSRDRPWTLDGFGSSFNKAKCGAHQPRSAFSRSEGNGSNPILRCRPLRTSDCRNHGLGGRARRPDHSAVRGSVRSNQVIYSAPQRKENINCKTGSKTTDGKLS